MGTKRTLQFLAVLALAWIVSAILILLNVFPLHPKTKTGWALFISLALPVYLVMEIAGSWMFSKEHGIQVSKREFSVLRVIIGILIIAIFMAIVLWITWVTMS